MKVIMRRRRRILFADFVARMEDMRLPKCVTFGGLTGGAGCVGGQGEEGIRFIRVYRLYCARGSIRIMILHRS